MSNSRQFQLAEDILQLAPNSKSVIDAHAYATSEGWDQLGTDGIFVWGMHQIPYGEPAQVAIDLALAQVGSRGLTCSCRQKDPCIHSIGLMLRYQQNPKTLPHSGKPAFVRDRFTRQRRYRVPQGDVLAEIQRGLAGLDLWLTNLIQHGLGEPHVREFAYWDEIADRMLAAWMPGISQWLREIANIPIRGGDWVEPLLNELGRLYLLVKSFERFELLPVDSQFDLREAVGWQLTLSDFESRTPVRDDWLVIGQPQRMLRDGTPERITWLYGTQSKRLAMLHDLGSEAVVSGLYAPVGRIFDLELTFVPSRSSLRAILVQSHSEFPVTSVTGISINEAVTQYSEAITANPWIRHYPMLIDNVYISRFDKYWTLRHADGTYLPIAPYFKHKWVTYAASAGNPVSVGGTWNGSTFFPLSVFNDQYVIDLTITLSYK